MNLLLQPNFSTPHNTYPFPHISIGDIDEAVQQGMQQENAEIDAITQNPASPTFDNTILPLANSGALLERATTLMYNQLSANTSEELEALAQRLSPILTEHAAGIMQNQSLFARVKVVWEEEMAHPVLSDENHMLLKQTYDGFERSGVTLSPELQQRFKAIKSELAQCSLHFSQNNIKATNAFFLHLTEETDLEGLPEGQIEQAVAAAQERNLEGWVITLHAPSYVPFMQYSTRRQHRETLYRAYMTKCTHDDAYNNFEHCRNLVNLRMEQAQLLGYRNYADYILRKRMAEREERVEELLNELKKHYLEAAKREVAAVEQMARSIEGDDFQMMPWDFAYYAHLLQRRDYNIDAEMLRPYFELSRVEEGVFGLAAKLYGIRFEENPTIPVYHDEVKAYDVFDADGSFLAVLYTDFFPRTSKQSGAWMTTYAEQYIDAQGVDHRPHVSVTMNFSKPTPSKPALLTFEEVETFLHEFGHALHGIFARTHHKSLSGTNVYWDFVELPSQFMENYARQPEFLKSFARHYQTGEIIPDTLIERINHAHNFNVAYACIRQVSFGLLDMAYYTRTEPLTTDISAFEQEAWSSVQLLPIVPEACMSVQFGHIMSGGYAAGYYSYKWAELLDADAFEAFLEEGLFSREVAQRFRDHILSRGGTLHPQILYNNFRGRPATLRALLKRDGIEILAASEH